MTANDTVDGSNLASNKMRVDSMIFKDGSTTLDDSSTVTSHGWNGYLEVICEWNRYDSAGAPIWPSGVSTGDEFVADNFGLTTLGTAGAFEKRCTFDGVFDQKKKSGWDAIIDAFQTGRAMPVKAGRKIIPVWDRPRDPVALFTMANVVEGSLELAYVSSASNPNSIETEILDSQHGYERRTVLVDHDSIQDPTAFGEVRKERTSLLGVTRDPRLVLSTEPLQPAAKTRQVLGRPRCAESPPRGPHPALARCPPVRLLGAAACRLRDAEHPPWL